MNLIEKGDAFFINNIPFNYPVTAGFTKPSIEGIDVKNDINKIFPGFDIAYMNQVHSPYVRYIDKPGIYTADGIITEKRKLVLIVKTADCLPLFVFDNKDRKIGVIHMGWRSASSGIINNINIDFKRSYVVAGAGLRKCCYEVGEEFLRIKELSSFVEKRNQKFYLDIISFAKNSFYRRGLKEKNFYDTGICSFCHKTRFFSYRRAKTKKRMLSFAVLG